MKPSDGIEHSELNGGGGVGQVREICLGGGGGGGGGGKEEIKNKWLERIVKAIHVYMGQ